MAKRSGESATGRHGSLSGYCCAFQRDPYLIKLCDVIQVSHMVQTQLLQRTSSAASEALDGNTQFKSNVSYDLATRIAKGLKLDLADILWDVESV